MLLVVAEDLKYNGLALDVLDEGLGHLYRNLEGKEGRHESYLKVPKKTQHYRPCPQHQFQP